MRILGPKNPRKNFFANFPEFPIRWNQIKTIITDNRKPHTPFFAERAKVCAVCVQKEAFLERPVHNYQWNQIKFADNKRKATMINVALQ